GRDRAGRRQRQIFENPDAGQLAAAALGQKHDIMAGLLQMPRQMQVLPREILMDEQKVHLPKGQRRAEVTFTAARVANGLIRHRVFSSSSWSWDAFSRIRMFIASSGSSVEAAPRQGFRYVPAPRSLPKRTSPDKRRRTGWRDAARVVPRNRSRAGGGRACRITARPEPTAFRRRAGESP